jgi:glycosyltransferase involved in cell wall biosynthesis
MPSPLASIGLPTYNRAKDLDRAIRSALAQDYDNLELIVCDNGSTDGTERLCREFAARDARVRYLRHPTNLGPGANFRRALAESRGEFFMWLGDDDWIDPSYVSQCADILMKDQSCSLACGVDHYYVGGKLERDGEPMNLDEATGIARVLSYYRHVNGNGAFYGLMRRQLIADTPMYEMLGGDWMLIAALAFHGKIRTAIGTNLHRTLAGVSSNWESLLSVFTLNDFQKANPGLTIAGAVFNDIAWRSPVYEVLGRSRRVMFATQAFFTVARRHRGGRQSVAALARQLVDAAIRRRL